MRKQILFIFAVVALLFIAGGVLVWQKKPPVDTPPVVPPTVTPPIIPTPPLNSLDTSTWKTYRNEEYGFEVKYPADWILKNPDKIIPFGNNPIYGMLQALNTPANEQRSKQEGYMEDIIISYKESISEYSNKLYSSRATTLDEFVHSEPFISRLEKISFANYPAYEMAQSGFDFYYTIMIDRKGEIYTIQFGNRNAKDKLTELDKGILSSFKFLE